MHRQKPELLHNSAVGGGSDPHNYVRSFPSSRAMWFNCYEAQTWAPSKHASDLLEKDNTNFRGNPKNPPRGDPRSGLISPRPAHDEDNT